MIITLFLIVMFLTALVRWIYGHRHNEDRYIGSIMTSIYGGLLLILFIFCLVINSATKIETKFQSLHDEIVIYQDEKEILDSYYIIIEMVDGERTVFFKSDVTNEVMSLQDFYDITDTYNDKVYKYIFEIKSQKSKRENPWINWFVSPAYDYISNDELTRLIFTGNMIHKI